MATSKPAAAVVHTCVSSSGTGYPACASASGLHQTCSQCRTPAAPSALAPGGEEGREVGRGGGKCGFEINIYG